MSFRRRPSTGTGRVYPEPTPAGGLDSSSLSSSAASASATASAGVPAAAYRKHSVMPNPNGLAALTEILDANSNLAMARSLNGDLPQSSNATPFGSNAATATKGGEGESHSTSFFGAFGGGGGKSRKSDPSILKFNGSTSNTSNAHTPGTHNASFSAASAVAGGMGPPPSAQHKKSIRVSASRASLFPLIPLPNNFGSQSMMFQGKEDSRQANSGHQSIAFRNREHFLLMSLLSSVALIALVIIDYYFLVVVQQPYLTSQWIWTILVWHALNFFVFMLAFVYANAAGNLLQLRLAILAGVLTVVGFAGRLTLEIVFMDYFPSQLSG